MTRYRGTCHCGAVEFQVETELDRVVRCNCSLCRRRGSLMHYVPPERFALLSGGERLVQYQFNTRTATHFFCENCGVFPFFRSDAVEEVYVVNVACLEGADVSALEPERIDGASY